MTRALVLGATGEMGRRVVAWLRALAPEVDVTGACRSGAGRSEVPLERADVADEAGLTTLLADFDVLVNAVGPYGYDPGPLVAACITSRCSYVDLCEAPDYLAALVAAVRRRGGAAAGVAFVPGCSTVPGLVQVLAQRFARDETARIDAYLSMGSANPVSAGLMAGLLRPLGRARPGGGRWFDRAMPREIGGRRLRFAPYPAPWPSAGLPLGGRRVPVAFHVGFDRGWITRALALAGRGLGRLPEDTVVAASRFLAPLAALARPLGTPLGVLRVAARDAAGRELGRVDVHATARGLDVPALPSLWVVQTVAAGAALPGGLLGLEAIVSVADACQGLAAAGYEVR